MAGKLALGKPPNCESVAVSILRDLCAGHDVTDSSGQLLSLDQQVERLAEVLLANSQGDNRGRTLYCFHRMPGNPQQDALHSAALTSIAEKLDGLKRTKPVKWGDVPDFVFLLLSGSGGVEFPARIVVDVMLTRIKHGRV